MSVRRVYIKDESFDPFNKAINREFYLKSRVLPGAIMALGFFILATQVAIPLVYFKTQDQVIEPMAGSVLGVATGFNDFSFKELSTKPGGKTDTIEKPKQNNAKQDKYFYISIPKLNIDKAVVEINSPSLSPDLTLGHYTGSALPGEIGNSFIYGHSVLPWFYNPKNYKTIFSTLDKLKQGDAIYINFNGKTYTYKVDSTKELAVSDVHPLEEFRPRYLKDSTITLMTCWPAGTRAKRLLVYAIGTGN